MSPVLVNPSRFGADVFNPKAIGGLVAWYSADAETGLSDNSSLATWHDQSGLGNNTVAMDGAPAWRSSGGPNSGRYIRFSNAGYYTLPNILSGATSAEIMATVIGTTDGSGSGSGIWAFGQGIGNNDESNYNYFGTVYESWGLPSGVRPSFGSAVGAWARYNIWSAPSDWAARINEVTKATTSSTPFFHASPLLGAGRKNSAVDLKFSGGFGCVAIYNRKLTTSERADLVTWMTANPSGGLP